MTIKTKPFNPFDHLDDPDEINAFLVDCFHDEDPNVFVMALGHWVKKQGVTEVSHLTGLSRESLYKSFNGKTQPKWDTLHRIIKALHIRIQSVA